MMNYVIASIVLFQNSLGGGVKSTTINNIVEINSKSEKRKNISEFFF